MKLGGHYNWKNQDDKLIYMGRNWSGNGYWHQFAKVENPGVVWCEVLDSDLHMIGETEMTEQNKQDIKGQIKSDHDMTPPAVYHLLKELRAARLAIRKMKDECNRFDDGYTIASSALKRINKTLTLYRNAKWS